MSGVRWILLVGMGLTFTPNSAGHASDLRIEPAQATLAGSDARQQLIVTLSSGNRETDVTQTAKFVSSDSGIATIDVHGVVRPVADGVVTITATNGQANATAQVVVRQGNQPLPISFRHDIIPLLTKTGCNSGNCHGKQAGRNGFKLSLFGFDHAFDYDAIVREARGRRLFRASPDRSLLLAKAAGQLPHGGGRRFDKGDPQYQLLLRWIDAGSPFESERDDVSLTGIQVVPASRVLSTHSRQQVIVTALFSDGSTSDVTHLSSYTTNNEALAQVDGNGLFATTNLGGEFAVMANYMGHVETCRVTIPMNAPLPKEARQSAWDTSHYIDRLLAEKWEKLNLAPSARCDDATFLRRATLDCIGRLPTPREVKDFLANPSPKKRTQLVEALLTRDEYADFWTVKWADLLRLNAEQLGAKNAYVFDAWLREVFRKNLPYDQFVRQLLTAQGDSFENGATNFYKAFAKPKDLTIASSQIFLGIRLECAQCHHHPYEKWGQDDFYGLAAFFPRLTRKRGTGGAELLFVGGKADVKHPRTGLIVAPRTLEGAPIELLPGEDRRKYLADWMTDPKNRFVARALVNRVWADFMGRGLVEPIDDMRATNPATSEELLAALAADFVKNGFDIKHLIRTITSSNAYGLSSIPNRWNVRDTYNYSRAYRKRIPAEVLLDAVSDVTGSTEEFAGMPPGTRAVQLWNNRLPSTFLDVFGRPERKTVCECERSDESSLGQVLHLMNAPLVNEKIQSPVGRAAQLARSKAAPDEIITELYLSALGRFPNDREMNSARKTFASPDSNRRTATEDVLWALLNTAEFVFNH